MHLVRLKQLNKTGTKYQNDLNALCGYSGDEIDIVAPSVCENSNLTSSRGAYDDNTVSTGSASLPSLEAYNDIIILKRPKATNKYIGASNSLYCQSFPSGFLF